LPEYSVLSARSTEAAERERGSQSVRRHAGDIRRRAPVLERVLPRLKHLDVTEERGLRPLVRDSSEARAHLLDCGRGESPPTA
jgi:hypothetical protein